MKLVVAVAALSFVVVGCNLPWAAPPDDHPPVPPGIDGDLGVGGPLGPQPTFGTTVTATTPPPPLSGGTLVMLESGQGAVAADPDRDRLYVVDLLPAARLRATLPLSPGDEPGRGVEDGAGRVHVLARRGGVVLTVDVASAAITERKAVCPAPRGIAYEAASDRVHVACAGGELVSLPAAGGDAVRTLRLDRDLRDV